MDVWPHRLLKPEEVGWSIVGASVDGGRPIGGGSSQRAFFGGGGVFVARLNGIVIRNRLEAGAWLALEALLDGGATPVVIPSCPSPVSPVIWPRAPGVPHSDGAPFNDGALYVSGVLSSRATAPAAFRATTLSFDILGGRPLIGGEHFSIFHQTAGWRIYRVARVLSATAVAGGFSYTVEFRCPLREAIPAAVEIDWETPRCVMKLADPNGMALDLKLMKFATKSVSFVEDDFPDGDDE